MKINSVYIYSFGGLKNKKIDFNDNINVIYAENETGKSTIMAFIKMMFYGTEGRSNDLTKNYRKKYTPWDNSQMSGYIDFENNSKKYRIERKFGASNSSDKITLIDLDLETRTTESYDIGVKFFGLSAASFERSIFIGQLGIPEQNSLANGEINAKLSNIAYSGDESTSYTLVSSRIENAKNKIISKNGKSGEYNKNISLLEKLKKSYSEQLIIQQTYNEKYEKKEELEKELLKEQEKQTELKHQLDKEKDYKNYKKLSDLIELKNQLDNLNKSLMLKDGNLADDLYAKKVEFCLSKIKLTTDKIKDKTSDAETITKSIKLADSSNTTADTSSKEAIKSELLNKTCLLKNEAENLNKKETYYTELCEKIKSSKNFKKSFNPVFLIISILFILLGSTFIILNSLIIGISTLFIGLLFITLTFIIKPINKKEITNINELITKTDTEIKALKEKNSSISVDIKLLQNKLDTIEIALNSNTSILNRQKELLTACNDSIEEEKFTLKSQYDDLYTCISKYKETKDISEIKQILNDISIKASKQKELKQQINYIVKDLDNISYEKAKEKLSLIEPSDYENKDFDSLKQQYNKSSKDITNYQTSLATINTELKLILTNAIAPEEIMKKIDNLKLNNEAQKSFYDACDIAINTLQDSFAELRRSFGSELENKASHIFSKLTANKYTNMGISKSFELTVEKSDTFGSQDLEYLSSGTIDQAYLSLRLALSELLFKENESHPLLLDDSLTQYDDKRLSFAIDFLKEYSESNQIILFTCHTAVINCSKNSGITTNNL